MQCPADSLSPRPSTQPRALFSCHVGGSTKLTPRRGPSRARLLSAQPQKWQNCFSLSSRKGGKQARTFISGMFKAESTRRPGSRNLSFTKGLNPASRCKWHCLGGAPPVSGMVPPPCSSITADEGWIYAGRCLPFSYQCNKMLKETKKNRPLGWCWQTIARRQTVWLKIVLQWRLNAIRPAWI